MAASNQQPFEVTDFSEGLMDDQYDQRYKAALVMDNFVIASDGKLVSRYGSLIDDTVNDQAPSGVQRISSLINYGSNDKLFVQAGKQFFYRDPSAYTILQGPTGNDVFSAGDYNSAPSFTQWNKQLFVATEDFPRPMKIYKDNLGDYQVRTSGLPFLASDPVVTAGGAGTNLYLYAFYYSYTYMVWDQEFEDIGPLSEVQLAGALAPDVSTVNISGIPVLANGATDNWDTSNVKIKIYRTIDSGETFYYVGEVTNGTTVYADSASDTSLQATNIVLYTDDGTVDFEPAPVSKFVHVVNNTGYYGVIKDGPEIFTNRVMQSVPGSPYAVPGDFYVDVEDFVQGISSTKSIPLVFCSKYIYRIEQSFDRYGRGQMTPIRISDTAGCVSNLSIVQAENYCLWAGQDGFYATDGYQVIKISDGINSIYRNMLDESTQANHIYGRFDELERRVYWTVQFDSSSLGNDALFVLDLRWGIKAASTFTTWSGNSFRPTSVEFFNGKLYRGDSRGYVFYHDEGILTDPKVDILSDAADWNKETIIWTYGSTNINFGSSFYRKMPTRILLSAANIANTTIQINAINDGGKATRELNLIRWQRNFEWGDPHFVWGDPGCVWNAVGLIEQWRRFPANPLRLSYVQIIITNGFGIITNSDTDGTATFDSTLNQVTLDGPTMAWPDDVVDYYITTEVDGYEKQYLVQTRNSDTVITVFDPEDTLPAGSLKWELYGYRKGEPLHLLGYNIHWNNVDQNQNTVEPGQSGSNA